MKCKCGSQAINVHLHGRGKDNQKLCDVCYWRSRAEKAEATNKRLRDAALWIINQWVCDREDGTISEDLCGRYNLCRRCSLIKALEGGE